jgi:acetyl-CoA C-acetyltransferase
VLADRAIRAGDAECIVAGGMENMSQAPHLLPGIRSGWKLGHQQVLDSMVHDGLWCAAENLSMGDEANYIAQQYNVSRADQDLFAAESHRRALAAWEAGWFNDEVVAVETGGARGPALVSRDEGPRSDSTPERLARLAPAFDPAGSVTAGNASQISDGAAAVVAVNENIARAHQSRLTCRVLATATAGVPPKELFIAPVPAVRRVLDRAGLELGEIDLVEMNEAFAAQCLACMRELGADPSRINHQGGAIALGHPIGASGARLLVTLMHALARRNLRFGLAVLCLGGGEAVAMVIERPSASC